MSVLFLIGLACLFLHELDAIQQQEWRFFLSWTGLNDTQAYRVFVTAHLPLFMLIIAYAGQRGFQMGMDVFLLAHALVHTLLRNHPHIQFNSAFSRLWIYGGAVFGALHLIELAVL